MKTKKLQKKNNQQKTNKKIKSKRRIKKIFKKRRKKQNFNQRQEDVRNNAYTTIHHFDIIEEEKEYKIIKHKSVLENIFDTIGFDTRKKYEFFKYYKNEDMTINGETIIIVDFKEINDAKIDTIYLNANSVSIFRNNTFNNNFHLEEIEKLQQQINRLNSEINKFKNTVENIKIREEPLNTAFRVFIEQINSIKDFNKNVKNEDNNQLNNNSENVSINDEEKIKKE